MIAPVRRTAASSFNLAPVVLCLMPHFLHRLPANGWAFALVILLLVAPCGALAADLFGRVVGISDGDTLTMLTPQREEVRIRLADIDTPERRQPYGTRARETLSALVFGRSVRVMVQDTDRYGRSVGRIFVGTQDVSAEMVRLGAAWVFRTLQSGSQSSSTGSGGAGRTARIMGAPGS